MRQLWLFSHDTIIQRYTLAMKTIEVEFFLEKKNATKEMI